MATPGERIRQLVTERWQTQRQAAEELGVHPALLSRWITNDERPPSEETIQMIADATNSTPWWIRYGVGATHRGEHPEMDADVASIARIAQLYASVDELLAFLTPEEALRAAFRAAMSNGWGLEAMQSLTEIARRLVPPDRIVELLG